MSRRTPSRPVVLKFGGAALVDGHAVRRACAVIAAAAHEAPVVVASAAAGVTRLLDETARAAAAGRLDLTRVRLRQRTLLAQLGLDPELSDRHLHELTLVLEDARERGELGAAARDHVLSLGERMSVRVLACALRATGVAATPVDTSDVGLVTDSNHGAARPLAGSGEAIRRALGAVPGIPVVTGFFAVDAAGRLTTLGPNGSDLTASLLAEALGAREVRFWKTVAGVMTADPALVPAARPIARLSWSQARAYAAAGADVLHPAALEPLARAGVPARVACVLAPDAPGTLITAEPGPRARPVGLAARPDGPGAVLERVGQAPPGAPGALELLARAGIHAQAAPDRLARACYEAAACASVRVAAGELAAAARCLHAAWFETASSTPARSAP